jgi:DNA processing protein
MFDGPITSDLDPAERRARLRLARSTRIGPITFHEALEHFGSADAACARLATVGDAAIAREEEALALAGGSFLVFGDPAYPPALASLPDAPPVLSTIGDLKLLGRPTLAVVGAREASAAGCRFATELAASLGAAGFVVASGLARGIDAAAHLAALPTGTVAVLAGGIDQIYPPQNAALHGEIAARGLLLSESPWSTPPVARAFPRRNRIVSGLSAGVVVIEAAARSGSLITAHRGYRVDGVREKPVLYGFFRHRRARRARLLEDAARHSARQHHLMDVQKVWSEARRDRQRSFVGFDQRARSPQVPQRGQVRST